MKVAVACDHGGFPLKQTVLDVLRNAGHESLDLGTNGPESVDYPDYARAAGEAVREGRVERAIVLCGSGIGASMTANKIRGIRAGVCHDTYSAKQGVEHDDMNVLCLGARVVGEAVAEELVLAFVGATFSGEDRHMRRLAKVRALEEQELPAGS